MPFIPHTEQDIQEMLETIGIANIETLFDEIPQSLRHAPLDNIPPGMSERELGRLARARAQQNLSHYCFIGAGAYEHHIPAAVWDVATRGEFMTAYTPYQPEASQGSLQLIYEYQTMMASLMGLEVSNASLYDGASGLAEAVLMAVRLQKNKSKILIPRSIHPYYRETVHTIVNQQKISLQEIPFNTDTGQVDFDYLQQCDLSDVAALIIPQPNFFGVLENIDELTDWAKKNNLLSIAVVNPMAMALLKPPGTWGEKGADIACGEGQSLGIPLASGGPYFGFLCTKKEFVRQMPGRIVGRTHDSQGKVGYVLTLQAREQHIRRGKATSNICTNQGLMVTASTIYMSLMGPQGLRNTAIECHQNTTLLQEKLRGISGIKKLFTSAFFHEMVLQLDQDVDAVLNALADVGIQAGVSLKKFYPELGESFLVCVTETKTKEDIDLLAAKLKQKGAVA